MPYKKGESGNPNGRTKGASNKSSARVKEAFQSLVEQNLEQMEEDLYSLKPKERLDVLMGLASYIMPKMKSIEVEATLQSDTTQQELLQQVYRLSDENIEKL